MRHLHLEALVDLRFKLQETNACTGQIDHGVSRSVYGRDKDGIDFELTWILPKEAWPTKLVSLTLDLDAEIARWSNTDTSTCWATNVLDYQCAS